MFYTDKLKSYQHTMYVGDFNLGDILWKSCDIVPFEINSNIESLLFDFLSIYTN